MDFIHINDVVEFYLILVSKSENLPNKTILKLGTGKGHNLRQVASYIEEITKTKTNINWGANAYRPLDVMKAIAEIEDTIRIIEWQPRVSFKNGLRDYIMTKLR